MGMIVALLYPATYHFFYDKNGTSYDPESQSRKRGRFRFNPAVRIPGPFTILDTRHTVIDDIYYPLILLSDWLEDQRN